MRKSLFVLTMLVVILLATGCGTSAATTTSITTYPSLTRATTSVATTTTATTITTATTKATSTTSKAAAATTSRAAVSTTKAATAAPAGSSINLINVSSSISAGSNASISIKGKPSTEYVCKVRYSSGYSTASGLGSKTSDGSGQVSWTWKVGSNTNPGTYNIYISGDGQTKTFSFTVR